MDGKSKKNHQSSSKKNRKMKKIKANRMHSYLMDPLVTSPLLSPLSSSMSGRFISSVGPVGLSPFSMDSFVYDGTTKKLFFEGRPNPLYAFLPYLRKEQYSLSTTEVTISRGKKKSSTTESTNSKNGTIVLDINRIKDVRFKPTCNNSFLRKICLQGLFGLCFGLGFCDDCLYGSHYRGLRLDDSETPRSSGEFTPDTQNSSKNPHIEHQNSKNPIIFGKIVIFYEIPEEIETKQFVLHGISYDVFLKLTLALQEAHFSFEEAEIEAKKKRLVALERQNPAKDFSFHVDFDMEEFIITEDTLGKYETQFAQFVPKLFVAGGSGSVSKKNDEDLGMPVLTSKTGISKAEENFEQQQENSEKKEEDFEKKEEYFEKKEENSEEKEEIFEKQEEIFEEKEEIFEKKEEIFEKKEEIFEKKEEIFEKQEEIFDKKEDGFESFEDMNDKALGIDPNQ